MTAEIENIKASLAAQSEQVARTQAETMVTQILLTGMMVEMRKRPDGAAAVASAFEFASSFLASSSSQHPDIAKRNVLVASLLENWRKMFLH